MIHTHTYTYITNTHARARVYIYIYIYTYAHREREGTFRAIQSFGTFASISDERSFSFRIERKAFLSRREAPQLLPFILFLSTRVHVIYLLIVFIALVIATRRERETRFGANDRAVVTPLSYVLSFPIKKM